MICRLAHRERSMDRNRCSRIWITQIFEHRNFKANLKIHRKYLCRRQGLETMIRAHSDWAHLLLPTRSRGTKSLARRWIGCRKSWELWILSSRTETSRRSSPLRESTCSWASVAWHFYFRFYTSGEALLNWGWIRHQAPRIGLSVPCEPASAPTVPSMISPPQEKTISLSTSIGTSKT